MRAVHWVFFGPALASIGCSLLVDPRSNYEYDRVDSGRRDGSIALDSGPRDGGSPDGARDACTLRTYYLDRDGDGFGDPSTAVEQCLPPTARHAENGDDCDDTRDDVHPGATEICDDVDQDCDFAVDEGLMGPLGAPIELSTATSVAWSGTVAHTGGFTVFWKSSEALEAAFFDRDGTRIIADSFIRGHDTRAHATGRFSRGLANQAMIAWIEPGSIYLAFCTPLGDCSARLLLRSGPTESLDALTVGQLRGHVIVSWSSPEGYQLRSIDPVRLRVDAELVLPLIDDADLTHYRGLATVDEPIPYTLIGRVAANVVGGSVTNYRAALVRVRGTSTFGHSAADDVFDLDIESRCADFGFETCGRIIAVDGYADRTQPFLLVNEFVISAGSAQGCFYGALGAEFDRLGGQECEEVTTNRVGFSLRGSLGVIATPLGATWGFREIPLSPAQAGSPYVTVPGLSDGPAVSGHRNRLVLVSSQERRVSAFRFGCLP